MLYVIFGPFMSVNTIVMLFFAGGNQFLSIIWTKAISHLNANDATQRRQFLSEVKPRQAVGILEPHCMSVSRHTVRPVHAQATFIFPVRVISSCSTCDIHFILLHMWWSISSCSTCDDPFHPAPHVMIHFTLPHRTTTIACSTMKRAETQAVLRMRYVHNNYCWTILPDSQGQACTKDLWFSFYWEMVIVMNFNA